MNGMDSFLLGKAMAENSQSLHSMFAGQRAAAADRREDQETTDLIRKLGNEAEELYTKNCRLIAEKRATAAFLKSVLKKGVDNNQEAWTDFYAAYDAVRIQAPDRFPPNAAKAFAEKLYADLQ